MFPSITSAASSTDMPVRCSAADSSRQLSIGG